LAPQFLPSLVTGIRCGSRSESLLYGRALVWLLLSKIKKDRYARGVLPVFLTGIQSLDARSDQLSDRIEDFFSLSCRRMREYASESSNRATWPCGLGPVWPYVG